MTLVVGNDISGCQDITWRCLGRSGVTRRLRFIRSETGPRKCISPTIPDAALDPLLLLAFQLEGNSRVRECYENVCVLPTHLMVSGTLGNIHFKTVPGNLW